MKFFFTFLIPVLFSNYAFSQEIKNIRAAREGEMVAIYFDLAGKTDSDVFGVQIFCSFNNYAEPLQFIMGDVGNRVSAGTGKKASWDFTKELGSYKGEVIFEVRATLVGGFYEFQTPSTYSKFKKGGLMPLNWSGGDPGDKVMIDLYKGDSKYSTITQSMENEGKFSWTVPKKAKSGGDYKVKITNTSNYNNTGMSAEFKISPKIPMALKVGAGVAILGVVGILASGGGGEDPGTTNPPDTDVDWLPAPPPEPTSGN